MIRIHLYGKLRKYASNSNVNQESIIEITPCNEETIGTLLERAGIPADHIFHLFYNCRLLYTHNTMAECLGYPRTGADFYDWNLNLPVKTGDRIGIFGRDMSALVV